MPNYRFCTLYSGSGGNAAYLETPSARILIDAGKCARTLTAALNNRNSKGEWVFRADETITARVSSRRWKASRPPA